MLVRQLDSHARVLLLICLCLVVILLTIIHSKSEILLPDQLRRKGFSHTHQNRTNANENLLQDVSNATLGVRSQSCHIVAKQLNQHSVPKDVRAWATVTD